MIKKFLTLVFPLLSLLTPSKTYALFGNFIPFKKLSPSKHKGSHALEHKNANILETSTKCLELLSHFEKKYGIPKNLLQAISAIESKTSPWAIYAKSRSHFFKNKAAALRFIHELKSQGVRNINIGCMQIDLKSHQNKFQNIEKVLMPYHNIEFAAKLLRKLYKRYGSWTDAVRYYHSGSSIYNLSYKERVFKKWARVNARNSKKDSQIDHEELKSVKTTLNYS